MNPAPYSRHTDRQPRPSEKKIAMVVLALIVGVAFIRMRNPSDLSQSDNLLGSRYKMPFHEQWIREHEAYPYQCWTDYGYNATLSDLPDDIQILCAMDYGKSDIDNGGFHQFFGNGTGVFAPEMAEWCARAGLEDVSSVIEQAMSRFGPIYPRSYEERNAFLDQFPPNGPREIWDPFHELDQQFYALLSSNGSRYEDAAEKWLRETCGIDKVTDPPGKRQPIEEASGNDEPPRP